MAQLDMYQRIQDLLADPRKIDQMVKGARDLANAPNTSVAGIVGAGSLDAMGGSAKTFAKQLTQARQDGRRYYLRHSFDRSRLVSFEHADRASARFVKRTGNSGRFCANTIILLVPSLNPDGVDIVKNWYHKTLGTPFEGTEPPELYHQYVGHDDNRDWYAFTQVETQTRRRQNSQRLASADRPRHSPAGRVRLALFLPPYMQPVEPNVPKQIIEGYTELGNFMAKEMRARVSRASPRIRLMTPGRPRAPTRIITAAYAFFPRRLRRGWPRRSR